MRTRLAAERSTIVLHPASAEDEAFLRALYTDRRAGEVAALGWEPAVAHAFVDMQFRAQQAGYGEAFPDADHWVVSVDDRPVGGLLVDRRADEHLVVDVVVLSAYRGIGIGTALMVELMGDARAAGTPVRVTVAAHEQRLVAWYQRLGFELVERVDPNFAMVWSPERGGGADDGVG